jgi:coronin-1B/1C/6
MCVAHLRNAQSLTQWAADLSVNYQVSGGGAFLVCPLSHTGKLPDVRFQTFSVDTLQSCAQIYPLARAHTAPVLDTAWNPFHEDIVASAGEDCALP